MNIIKNIFLWAKGFLFPGACALCGGSLTEPVGMQNSLCCSCMDSITLARGSKCDLCGKPLISEIGTCLPCRNGGEKSYERLWVLFPYIGKFRKLLTAYKFGKNLALADFFVGKIHEVISGILPQMPELKDAVIVPVPPRPGKIKETGWDQIDYLVKRLEKNPACLPVLRLLKRKRSKAQKRLSRAERLDNLKGRIYLKKAYASKLSNISKTFILIDDVITTGSTIEVCSAVLKEAGAEKVYGICLFFD